MNSPVLFLFTASYPYGSKETPFLQNEIDELSKQFSQIYIFPMHVNGDSYKLPENVTAINLFQDYTYKKSYFDFKQNYTAFKILFSEILKKDHAVKIISNTQTLMSNLFHYYQKSQILGEWLRNKKIDNAVFYTYWFDEWSTILSIIRKNNPNAKFASRAHGFDLYGYRNHLSFIPFRNYQLKNFDMIFPVSENGVQYLQNEFPKYKNKIVLSYLGITDNGINPFDPQKKIRIVSCSNISKEKRVALIAEALSKLDFEVHWIHFGDGQFMKVVQTEVKKLGSNISVSLVGDKKNEEVINYYKNNSVNLFLNVSESEGLPVSIMEAISFGIPVIAPNVGGVSEIVNEQTGILLPKDFTISDLANKISFFRNSEMNDLPFRKKVRIFWENNFKATKNYSDFCQMLLEK